MTSTAAPVSGPEDMRALAIAGITQMVDALAIHPKDVWAHFNQAKGAIALAEHMALVTAKESQELMQMATEARLSVCVEPEPVSSEYVQDLNERLVQIKADPVNAWARFRAFEERIRGYQEFCLIADDSAKNYLAAANRSRDAALSGSIPKHETKNS